MMRTVSKEREQKRNATSKRETKTDDPPYLAPLSFWQSGRQAFTNLTRGFASQPRGWFAVIEESFVV